MNKYSKLEKILHRQFLGDNSLSSYLYNKLKKESKKKINYCFEKVFILGLARSGTTALLNKLYSSGEFSSFLYKHMPFILAPELANLYSKFVHENEEIERYHKDKIKINNKSPECLDEPFWLKALSSMYKEETIDQVCISKEIIDSYNYLLYRFCKMQKKEKIIIKNNNNLVRLNSLVDSLPNSTFIILFREPLQQSYSMLQQHLNFLKLRKTDPFIEEYMNFLGHYEFGECAKSFNYGKNNFSSSQIYTKNSINYWLTQWINNYNNLINNTHILNKENIVLISYHKLCNNKNIYDFIAKKLNIKEQNNTYNLSEKIHDIESTQLISPELEEKSMIIYNTLTKEAI